jgi:hypothetical protein
LASDAVTVVAALVAALEVGRADERELAVAVVDACRLDDELTHRVAVSAVACG